MRVTKSVFIMVVMTMVFSVVAETPVVSDISVRQRWPWSREVDIEYVLDCEPGSLYDIDVKIYQGTEPVTFSPESLSGDIHGVDYGLRRMVWKPTPPAGSKGVIYNNLRIELTPVEIPLYMILDLTKNPGADGQIKYIYEGELTNEVYGSFERDPISNLDEPLKSVVWTAVTNGTEYKCEKMVLRRIPAGTFEMGDVTKYTTTISKPSYVGVFLVTQRQWELIYGDRPSRYGDDSYYMTRPVETISYNLVRGSKDDNPKVEWPETGSLVSDDSFLGLMRAQTGINTLDIMTEAQWEYACRAGTTTDFFTGENLAEGANADSNAQADVLGRYNANGGCDPQEGGGFSHAPSNRDPDSGTALVGSYPVNAWGLYDVAGNLMERCRTWNGALQGGIDPKGADTDPSNPNQYRNTRGGAWSLGASYMRTGNRGGQAKPDAVSTAAGFRVILELQ